MAVLLSTLLIGGRSTVGDGLAESDTAPFTRPDTGPRCLQSAGRRASRSGKISGVAVLDELDEAIWEPFSRSYAMLDGALFGAAEVDDYAAARPPDAFTAAT